MSSLSGSNPVSAVAKRILIVEDDPSLLKMYSSALQGAGCLTHNVREGEAVAAACAQFQPHLVILDIRLAGRLDGFEVLAQLRAENKDVFVIVLTGEGAEESIVAGLGLGADNYLVKPISRSQLAARVTAQLGRTPSGQVVAPSGVYHYRALELDLDAGAARRGSKLVPLSQTERGLLAVLLQSAGRVIPYEEVERSVLQYQTAGFRPADRKVLQNVVHRLREKLAEVGAPKLIQTKRLGGVSIAAPDAVATADGLVAERRPGARARSTLKGPGKRKRKA